MPLDFHLPTIRHDRLLERFLRYVQIETTADPRSVSYPSTATQFDLGKVLSDEIRAMGLDDVELDAHGLVWATVPATAVDRESGTVGADLATIALVAHMDTSPDAPGAGVRPQVVKNYNGDPIELPNGQVIDPVDVEGGMSHLVGKTLITTDGTTLLGGDDKAGVAIIMELAETLMENPSIPHGRVRLLMTCDEEIGKGTDKIDLAKLNADVAYTLDGGAARIIDVETFSADAAVVTFTGRNIHPSIGKGRMVNAVRAAAQLVHRLPVDVQAPESTEAREGFLHPHTIEGDVSTAKVHLILRSFESEELHRFGIQIQTLAQQVAADFPGIQVDVAIDRQYRNMGEGLAKMPSAVDVPLRAAEALGRPFEQQIIRGGTDGSQLTEKGLPTPNLSSGQYNIHSTREFACLDDMAEAVEHLVVTLREWARQPS
ncbi:MAG: peptidase T [Planctomycetota bacterium]